MRRTLVALCVGLILALFFSTTAFANYYAIGMFSSSTAYGGGTVNFDIESLSASDCSGGGHTNQTIGVGTNNTTGGYWAEVGYTYGYHGSCVLTYYWARNNPTYGY